MRFSQYLVLVYFGFGLLANAQVGEQGTAVAQPQEQESVKIEPPTSEKSLLKTAATADFNKPLFFDQVGYGIIFPPMEFEYELAEGKNLKIGDVAFNQKTFFFSFQPLGKIIPQLSQIAGRDTAKNPMLIMFWPEKLTSKNPLTVEIISRTGDVVWTYSVTENDRNQWQKKLRTWRQGIIDNNLATKARNSALFISQLALDVKALKIPLLQQRDSFRFCISQAEEKLSTRMCSQKYAIKSIDGSTIMGRLRTDAIAPRIIVQNQEAPLKDSKPVNLDQPLSFYSELSTGESLEFVAIPNKLELMDIADSRKPNFVRVVGYGTRPTVPSVILNPDQYGKLTKILGFEATIGDPRKFWAALMSTEEPRLYLPGKGGGIFKQKFEMSEIPRNQSRVFLSKRTTSGTYRDQVTLEGRKHPDSKVTSTQNSVEQDPQDPSLFKWNFAVAERGKINRSYLNIEFKDKTYRSYYEIHKGFPREISGRFSGVQLGSSFIVMGEVAYNQWFEKVLNWDNYWVSNQRWGVSINYFQSFNSLKVDNAGNTAALSVMNANIKYRGTPGLWGRDESVGALLSYQSVTFDRVKAPMIGAGAFWARSMPRVFDDMFNILPIMRYPKWVDMEFIYYVSPLDPNIKLNASMSLNFHGKVLWSDRYFGEAGFGIKRYGFIDSSLSQKAELNTFYGTVGLGINF